MDQSPEETTFRWKWLAVLPLVPLAIWLAFLWVTPDYDPPQQPVPNAYEDIARLSKQISPRTGFYDSMPEQELASTVAANEDLLSDVREALRKESMVPLVWEGDPSWFQSHVQGMGDLRSLARAFAAEGFRARKQGDSHAAIQCGLDNLLLARAISCGGLGTDWLVGMTIYQIGTGNLFDTLEIATEDDCRIVIRSLPQIRAHFEPPAEITIREWHYWRQVYGAYQTFLTELSFTNNRTMFESRLESLAKLYQAGTDLLKLHYAIKLFELTNSRLPENLHQLAGQVLKIVPHDPFSEKEFIYLPGKDQYILYSVGPNGVDDGGSLSNDPLQGDLMLQHGDIRDVQTVPESD